MGRFEFTTSSESQVMTIVNVTPDSFYAPSRAQQSHTIHRAIEQALEQGSSIIDIGGYSTRPGAAQVSEAEERERVLRGVRAAREVSTDIPISIDTFRSGVIAAVVEQYGEVIVNDITAATADSRMAAVAGEYDLPFVAMHSRGTPQTMQQMTGYTDVAREVTDYLSERIKLLHSAGVSRVAVDPGFGFAKSIDENYALVAGLELLLETGCPIVAGISRKSMIYRPLDTTPDQIDAPMAALHWELLRKGATILRVHDTRQAKQIIEIFKLYRQQWNVKQ